jgi:hypothetical protein
MSDPNPNPLDYEHPPLAAQVDPAGPQPALGSRVLTWWARVFPTVMVWIVIVSLILVVLGETLRWIKRGW